MTDIDAILTERKATHGEYKNVAKCAQSLKRVFRGAPNWSRIPDDMRESFDMAANKFARILCGDPTFIDHWEDVIGYMTLPLNDLQKPVEETLEAAE